MCNILKSTTEKIEIRNHHLYIFEPFFSFFSTQRIFNKSINGSLNKLNITSHCGKISGPEEAASAIVEKGGSLEDVDKTKKNVSIY